MTKAIDREQFASDLMTLDTTATALFCIAMYNLKLLKVSFATRIMFWLIAKKKKVTVDRLVHHGFLYLPSYRDRVFGNIVQFIKNGGYSQLQLEVLVDVYDYVAKRGG